MQGWFRIRLTMAEIADGKNFALQDAITSRLGAAGYRQGAALFQSNPLAALAGGLSNTLDTDYFLSPSAAALAADILAKTGGVPCEPPERALVILLFGYEGDADRLLA